MRADDKDQRRQTVQYKAANYFIIQLRNGRMFKNILKSDVYKKFTEALCNGRPEDPAMPIMCRLFLIENMPDFEKCFTVPVDNVYARKFKLFCLFLAGKKKYQDFKKELKEINIEIYGDRLKPEVDKDRLLLQDIAAGMYQDILLSPYYMEHAKIALEIEDKEKFKHVIEYLKTCIGRTINDPTVLIPEEFAQSYFELSAKLEGKEYVRKPIKKDDKLAEYRDLKKARNLLYKDISGGKYAGVLSDFMIEHIVMLMNCYESNSNAFDDVFKSMIIAMLGREDDSYLKNGCTSKLAVQEFKARCSYCTGLMPFKEFWDIMLTNALGDRWFKPELFE